MSAITNYKTREHLIVRTLEPMEVIAAEQLCRRFAASDEECAEFLEMVVPERFRCANCRRQFPVPSLARDCEEKHEQEKEQTDG